MATKVIQQITSKVLLIIGFLFLSIVAFSEEKTQIRVSITDENNLPLVESMAFIRNLKSTKVIRSGICDKNGNIIIKAVKKGKYMILVNKTDLKSVVVATFEILEVKNEPVEIYVIFDSKKEKDNRISMEGVAKFKTEEGSKL